jgi:hypothetical protein
LTAELLKELEFQNDGKSNVWECRLADERVPALRFSRYTNAAGDYWMFTFRSGAPTHVVDLLSVIRLIVQQSTQAASELAIAKIHDALGLNLLLEKVMDRIPERI